MADQRRRLGPFGTKEHRRCSAPLKATIDDIRALFTLLPADDYPTRLVVDTNALIDNPNVAATPMSSAQPMSFTYCLSSWVNSMTSNAPAATTSSGRALRKR